MPTTRLPRAPSRGRRWGAAAALVLVAVTGCAAARTVAEPVAAEERVPRRPPLPLVRGPRLFLLPGDRKIPAAFEDPDGTRRLLLEGMRLAIHPDGSVSRGEELLPYDCVTAIELPERLGGGVLFVALSGGDTLIWRAESWTSKLEPLAHLGFPAQAVVPGFDRLLVHVKGSNEVVALSVQDGRALEYTGLPETPGARHLAFADAWMGVVDVPIRGTLATFDAGVTWTSLGLGASVGLVAEDGRVVIRRPDRNLSLDPAGHLSWVEDSDEASVEKDDSADADADTERAALVPGPLGHEPLRAAVISGWPDSAQTAVVAAQGNLARVRLADGKVIAVAKRALPASEECHGVALGGGFGFVCGRDEGGTVVYAFEPPLSLRPVLRFEAPRYVASSGNGALVIRGGCRGGSAHDSTRYCIVTPTGVLREIRVKGDHGVERVVALHDGRTAVIVPPRFGAPGQVTLVAANGSLKSVRMKLPEPGAERSMVRKGLWLDGFMETPKGELAGWVAAGGPFVGVRVSLSGRVEVGAIEKEIERALLSGQIGMVLGRSGVASETTDGGFNWRDVDLLVDVDAMATASSSRGCSRVGCVVGDWVRIGWRGRRGKRDPLKEAESPRATTMTRSAGGRWLVQCAPTAEMVRVPSATIQPTQPTFPTVPPRASSYMLTADEVRSTSWSSFQGMPAPQMAPTDVGLDYATASADLPIHVYAWGGRAADWTRAGQWIIRGSDPFAIRGGVWSTAATRSPWDDVVAAATAFGQNVHSSSSSSWTVATEPSGRGGVLFVTTSTGTDLYLFEAGRSIVKVGAAAGLGVKVAAGVVKTGGRWYLGAQRETFRIYEVVGNGIRMVGDYPLLLDGDARSSQQTTLVRNDTADALAIWVRANRTRGSETEWFVYPVDPDTGAVSEPTLIDRAQLAKMPDACSDGDSGWELVGIPPVSPFVELQGDARGFSTPRSVRARLIVGARGVCIDALTAELDSAMPLHPAIGAADWAGKRITVPMFVSDRAHSGARWKFRCTR